MRLVADGAPCPDTEHRPVGRTRPGGGGGASGQRRATEEAEGRDVGLAYGAALAAGEAPGDGDAFGSIDGGGVMSGIGGGVEIGPFPAG